MAGLLDLFKFGRRNIYKISRKVLRQFDMLNSYIQKKHSHDIIYRYITRLWFYCDWQIQPFEWAEAEQDKIDVFLNANYTMEQLPQFTNKGVQRIQFDELIFSIKDVISIVHVDKNTFNRFTQTNSFLRRYKDIFNTNTSKLRVTFCVADETREGIYKSVLKRSNNKVGENFGVDVNSIKYNVYKIKNKVY